MISAYLTVHTATVFKTFCVLLATTIAGFGFGIYTGEYGINKDTKLNPLWVIVMLFGIAAVAFLVLIFLL